MNDVPPAKQEHPAGPAQDADPDLARIAAAWPTLPEFIRLRIMALAIVGPDEFYATKKGLVRVRGAVLGYKTCHPWTSALLQKYGITSWNYDARLAEKLGADGGFVSEELRKEWDCPSAEPKLLAHGSCGRLP